MIRQIIICLTVILFAVGKCSATQEIETQIGPFDLASPPVSESKIISQFGQGYVEVNKSANETLEKKQIYYAPDQKVWVEIRFSHVLNAKLEHIVEEILVTKYKLCDEKFQPSKPFGSLITSRGIQIGDSEEKIIQTYGAPSISIEIGKDKIFSVLAADLKLKEGRILRYLTNRQGELIFAEFYFNEKELHSLLISGSE
jgi:hypothetical protein